MRVGVHFGDFQPDSGGAYTFVAGLLEAFSALASASAHDFVLLCGPGSVDSMRKKVALPNVVVVAAPRISRFGRLPAALKYYSAPFRRIWNRRGPLERAARRHEVELVWFVGSGAFECPDIPYIATIWDLQHRYQPFFPEVSANGAWDDREQFYAYFLRRAAYCVTGTLVGKRQIEQLYQLAEPRVRVLPTPTPLFALNAQSQPIDVRNRFHLKREYVFYPAQFWPHKNHANLILAVKKLKEERGLELTIAFSGSDKGNLEYVRSFADRHGMSDHVAFLGFVSEDELVALYQQTVALTYVTYFGPDNTPPLEAFALGAPVVASSVEGAAEQYGDAALLVDPSDPAAIANAILSVHHDERVRRDLIEAGYRRARSWTAADYVRGMFKLFDEFSLVRRTWPAAVSP